jgi:REP element-mobilizing transposase RayT
LSVPGGVFHLVSRFARDEWWLDRAGAREAYLTLLGAATQKSDAAVLAYCLMSSHVHLIVVQGEEPLERFTKSVHTGFAGWAQRSRRRDKALGAVFAGRPRAVLVEEEGYLLELVRYVHNNPVRAGLVRVARNSAWSSHMAYVGLSAAPRWLRMGYVLERFGRDGKRAATRFDAFVDAGRAQLRRPELSGAADAGEAAQVRRALGDGHRVSDGVLGSDAFVARVRRDARRVEATLSSRGRERRSGASLRPPVREVIDAVLAHRDVDGLELSERPRSQRSAGVKKLAVWLWVHEYAGRQIEVARALGLDTSVVSRHYGEALVQAGDFDQEATAVKALLAKRSRPRACKVTPATEDAQPVRYHVDVEET